jgi:aminoglycoside phosphotransferase (APT) family kinase protein
MPTGKMHDDEVDTNTALVRRLIAAQFPQWADRPLTPVDSAGTDNALYQLGDDMVVRLPRIAWAVGQVEKEQRWLPKLAPYLPLAIPIPLAQGSPGAGYPWHWSVYRWLAGENATFDRLADPIQTAQDLARFIIALQQIDTTGGPPSGPPNSWRGVPLAGLDDRVRAAIPTLPTMINADAVTAAWDTALNTPAYDTTPVWLHGDIQAGNLLAQQGRLSAVIDWGCLGVGDPACDVQVAWNLFDAHTRTAFHAALEVDDATWARGRGWALYFGVLALPYYQYTNPVLAGIARHAIDQVLTDHAHGA